jgi:hypothetical protein
MLVECAGVIRGDLMRKLAILAVLIASTVSVFAQSAPIKMGLWEKRMTMDTGTGAPTNINTKSCVTLETWQEMVGNMDKKRDDGCTVDKQKSDHGYTFTATCKTPKGGTMVTTGSASIKDSEHIIAQSHTTITTNGQKRVMEMKSTSTYLGASCGDVKPDEPQTEDN